MSSAAPEPTSLKTDLLVPAPDRGRLREARTAYVLYKQRIVTELSLQLQLLAVATGTVCLAGSKITRPPRLRIGDVVVIAPGQSVVMEGQTLHGAQLHWLTLEVAPSTAQIVPVTLAQAPAERSQVRWGVKRHRLLKGRGTDRVLAEVWSFAGGVTRPQRGLEGPALVIPIHGDILIESDSRDSVTLKPHQGHIVGDREAVVLSDGCRNDYSDPNIGAFCEAYVIGF